MNVLAGSVKAGPRVAIAGVAVMTIEAAGIDRRVSS